MRGAPERQAPPGSRCGNWARGCVRVWVGAPAGSPTHKRTPPHSVFTVVSAPPSVEKSPRPQQGPRARTQKNPPGTSPRAEFSAPSQPTRRSHRRAACEFPGGSEDNVDSPAGSARHNDFIFFGPGRPGQGPGNFGKIFRDFPEISEIPTWTRDARTAPQATTTHPHGDQEA